MEKAMAPHSSTLPWKIPWMEEPGGLQSMGLWRVGHDWAISLSLLPASGSFPMSQIFASGGQNIGASASRSVLAKNIQSWFHLEFTGLIPLQSKGLSGVFTSTNIWKHPHSSLLYSPTLISVHNYWKNHSFDYMEICWQTDVSAF